MDIVDDQFKKLEALDTLPSLCGREYHGQVVSLEPQERLRLVLNRTVANVGSTGFVVRK